MLTTSQKYFVLRTLCYPAGTIDPTSLDYSKIVSDKINNIDGDIQVEVETILDWIEKTDKQLSALISSQNVKRVDDIEFFENSTDDVKKQKTRYINDLCSFIGIPSRCKGSVMGGVCC